MLKRISSITIVAVLAVIFMSPMASTQNMSRQYDSNNYQYGDNYSNNNNQDRSYGDRGRIDRYLDAQVWTNHDDGEYYEGDNITIHFRVNRDAFVVIYTIDTRGRLNMLFPTDPTEDNFVNGGVTYQLPAGWDDYDLVVTGPEGVETIQIIASREQIPIPDWYPQSGVVCDMDDRYDFLDYINDRYFVRYGGQRFAYDRTSINVDEWEQYYFRPVYRPEYYNWTLSGNVYLDYPFGASVYVNGIYWGCTPLYLPRVYVGWNTFTIYDDWGYCWESDIHVSRYQTVILNDEVVRPGPDVQSRYKKVRMAGYRNPVSNGYPKYTTKKTMILNSKSVTRKKVVLTSRNGKKVTEVETIAPKKNVRGSASLVRTERGWETTGFIRSSSTKRAYGKSSRRTAIGNSSGDWRSNGSGRTSDYSSKSTGSSNYGKSQRSTVTRGNRSSGSSKAKVAQRKTVTRSKGSSSGYYQKKSSGSHSKSRGSSSFRSKSGNSSHGSSKGKSGSVKSSGSKSSGASTKSTGGSSKSSGSKSKGKGRR